MLTYMPSEKLVVTPIASQFWFLVPPQGASTSMVIRARNVEQVHVAADHNSRISVAGFLIYFASRCSYLRCLKTSFCSSVRPKSTGAVRLTRHDEAGLC
jgi:hypothetical protein